jgi:hypothetical protein
MEIKFVTDETIAELTNRGRRGNNLPWAEFIEELYKHPNRWAEFPYKVNTSASAYAPASKFKDIEIRVSGGNNLRKNHKDKKQWTVFLRFVPEIPAKIEEPKAPNKKR